MNVIGMQSWRRVRNKDLEHWAGAGRLELARALVKASGVRELLCSWAGEGIARIHDPRHDEAFFAAVQMEVDRRRKQRTFTSLCACGRRSCVHPVAVAVALRNAVAARKTPARMPEEVRRVLDLPAGGTVAQAFRIVDREEVWVPGEWWPDEPANLEDDGGSGIPY